MIKYFTTLQNERGDVLPSYRAQVTDSAGSVVTIYADKGGTRFTDASGNNVNYATADEKGRISFYFTPAVGQTLQTLDVAGNLQDGEADFADSMVLDTLPGEIAQSAVTDLTTDLAAKANSADVNSAADLASTASGKGADLVAGAAKSIATRAAMKALTSAADKARPLHLTDGTRKGVFVWDGSNLSTAVATDAQEGVYVAPTSDATGASGAWVRQFAGVVNASWFGATGDGATDDTTAIQAAIDFVELNGGGVVKLDEGRYVNTGLVLKDGVSLHGAGMVHRVFYKAQPTKVFGTVLLCTVGAGLNCINFEDTPQGHNGIRDLSVFEDGTAAFGACIATNGTLHASLENVELGCLTTVNRGTGLLLNRGTHGGGSIYGVFSNVVTTQATTGLRMEDDANANVFNGGSFQGSVYSLHCTVNATASGPQGNSFNGAAFESSYNSAIQDIEFISDASNIHGFSNVASAYIVKTVLVTHADGLEFSGCYFENGGASATYDDGTNGVASVVPCIAIDAATASNAKDITWTGRIAGYVYDTGQNCRFSLIPSGRPYTTNRPISLIRRNTTATAVANATLTPLTYVNTPSWANNVAQEIGYDNATGVITFKQAGLYKVYAQIFFPSTTASFLYLKANINSGAASYFGPNGAAASERSLMIDFLYDADVGDTCVIQMFQNSGASVTVSAAADHSHLHVTKLSA